MTADELKYRMAIFLSMVLVAVGLFAIHHFGTYDFTEEDALSAATAAGLTDVEVGAPCMNVFLRGDECDGYLAHRTVSGATADGRHVKTVVCGGAATTPAMAAP